MRSLKPGTRSGEDSCLHCWQPRLSEADLGWWELSCGRKRGDGEKLSSQGISLPQRLLSLQFNPGTPPTVENMEAGEENDSPSLETSWMAPSPPFASESAVTTS